MQIQRNYSYFNKNVTKRSYNRCCRLMASSTEEVGLRLPVFLRTLPDMIRDD